ncbi:HAD family hydrolase [Halobacillus seohaensis]|uniref:HAD hydrolase-like protein n=1 Tax=Halobacillus seohaensis TaxID=447421 RepID=A0ABW2EKA7_9BACI
MIKEAKCLIFDLDGTLYEDTHHFEFYANLLKKELTSEKQNDFKKDYLEIMAGEHPLTIGKAYDRIHDQILSIDPYTDRVVAVHEWNGEQWEDEKVLERYNKPVTYDFEKVIAIGDGWWLPFSVANHYGLSLEKCYQCYMLTKEFMVSEQFVLTKTPGLKASMEKWKKEKWLVLVTNSELYDVNNLLRELELENIFDQVISSAKKPTLTKKHYGDILLAYELFPEEVISIGDNFINEVAPALTKNMKAILIQPNAVTYNHPNLKVVPSFRNVLRPETLTK